MRSLRDIKRLVAHAPVHATPSGNRAVFEDLTKELAGRRIEGNTIRFRVASLAVAAAVVVVAAVGYLSREPIQRPPRVETASAADMLTIGRLNAACRQGGLAEVERQCEQAARRTRSRPERVSVEQLITEMKGT